MWAQLQDNRNGPISDQVSGENTWSSDSVTRIDDEILIRPSDLHADAVSLVETIPRGSTLISKLFKALSAVLQFVQNNLTRRLFTTSKYNNTTHITQVASGFRSLNRLMRETTDTSNIEDLDEVLGYCYLKITNISFTGNPYWLDAKSVIILPVINTNEPKAKWSITPATETLPWLVHIETPGYITHAELALWANVQAFIGAPGKVFGKQGSDQSMFIKHSWAKVPHFINKHGVTYPNPDSPCHWQEIRDIYGRGVGNNTYANLNEDALELCESKNLNCAFEAFAQGELSALYDQSSSFFKKWVRHSNNATLRKVAIIAGNYAANQATCRPVSELMEGAERGIVFAILPESKRANHQVTQLQLPGDHHTDTGVVGCPACGYVSRVQGSGPSESNMTTCKCGQILFEEGGDYWHKNLMILRRCQTWTGKFKQGPLGSVDAQIFDKIRAQGQQIGIWPGDALFSDTRTDITDHCYGDIHPSWDIIYLPLKFGQERYLTHVRFLPAFHGSHLSYYGIGNLVNENPSARNVITLGEKFMSHFCSIPSNFSPAFGGGCCLRGEHFRLEEPFWRTLMSRHAFTYGVDEYFFLNRNPLLLIKNSDTLKTTGLIPYQIRLPSFMIAWCDEENPDWVQVYQLKDFNSSNIYKLAHRNFEKSLPQFGLSSECLWNSYEDALQRCQEFAMNNDVFEKFQPHQRVPRAGRRLSYAALEMPEGTNYSEDVMADGAGWRPEETCFGLRSSSAWGFTQNGMNPDLIKLIRKISMQKVKLHEFPILDLKIQLEKLMEWLTDLPLNATIALAGVYDEEQAKAFTNEMTPHFDYTIVFSDKEFPFESFDERMYYIKVPLIYGQGHSVALTRLAPYLLSVDRDDVILVTVNDPSITFAEMPNKPMLAKKVLEYTKLTCVSNEFHSPYSGAHVVGLPGSLELGLENFLQLLSMLGWCYSIDELVLAAFRVPTSLTDQLSMGGIPPTHRQGHSLNYDILTEYSSVYRRLEYSMPFGAKMVPINTTAMAKQRKFMPPIPMEFELSEYQEWIKDSLRGLNKEIPILLIFSWGTRGDRVPVSYMCKQLRRFNIRAYVLHLLTPEEGVHDLGLCEKRMAHQLLPKIGTARDIIRAAPVSHKLHPYFMAKSEGTISYGLMPTPETSGAPRGGLHEFADQFVPHLLKFFPVDVHIAFSDKLGYFERSHNGLVPLTPQNHIGQGGEIVVTGSSTIPIPAALSHLPVLPPCDHLEELRFYDKVYCAGGAGLVQTCKAAGVPVVSVWTKDIDRQWNNPENAGENVRVGNPTDSYSVLAFALRPSFKAGWTIIRNWSLIKLYLKFQFNRFQLFKIVWNLIFLAYSLRYKAVIMPTLNQTIVRTFLGSLANRGLIGWFYNSLALTFLTMFKNRLGMSTMGFLWFLTKLAMRASLHPSFIPILNFGFSVNQALLASFILSKLFAGGIPILTHHVRIGRLNKDKGDSGIWLGLQLVKAHRIFYGLHSMYYDVEQETTAQGTFTGSSNMAESFKFSETKSEMSPGAIWLKTDLVSKDLIWKAVPLGRYSPIWNCQIQTLAIALGSSSAINLLPAIAIFLGTTWAVILLTIAYLSMIFGQGLCHTALFVTTPLKIWDIDFSREITNLSERISTTPLLFKFGASRPDPSDYDRQSLENLREALSMTCAMAIDDGIPPDVAFEAAGLTLLNITGAVEEMPFAEGRPEVVTSKAYTADERSDAYASMICNFRKQGIPEGLIEAIARVMTAILDSSTYVSLFIGAWLGVAVDYILHFSAKAGLTNLIDVLDDAICQILPTHRHRKNAWAPMSKTFTERLTFTDWLSLSLNSHMTVLDPESPIDWTIDRLNSFLPNNQQPLEKNLIYNRTPYLPTKPRATRYELEYPSLINSVSATIDPTLQARAEMYESMGATPGTDGIWLSDKDSSTEELKARYLAHGKPWTPEEEALMEASVQMLYNEHKECFDKPGIVTPETVKRHIKMKFSPGVPFIGRFKKRSELLTTGWMDSIIQSTYKHLEEGTYPPQLYHVFPKSQIVLKPRQVTAEGLTSTFVSQVSQLELMKRPIWDQVGFGLGMPLNAKHLGDVFERVNKRKLAFKADVRQFDSNTPPIVYEGLARLMERGVRAGGNPAVAAIQRARLISMQNSTLINLTGGEIIKKNRGGGTGQSATSFDNHWAYRLFAVMCWSATTGLPPEKFYETNSIHNTSDDNLWSTDDDFDLDELVNNAEALFGYNLKIEQKGTVMDLQYLGRIPIKTDSLPEEALIAGLADQEFVAGPYRPQILSRRSAILTRFSGQPYSKYMKWSLQRTIGHLQLCAFDRELYSLLLKEYMEDAAGFVGVPNAIIWDNKFDRNGLCISVRPLLRANFKLSPRAMARFKLLSTASLKAPSYYTVLKISGKEKIIDDHISKYRYSVIKPSYETVIKASIIGARAKWYSYLPTHLAKLDSSNDALPLAPLTWLPGWPVEKFVFRRMMSERESTEIPSLDEISIRLRESPFSSATDAVGFYWWLQIPGSLEVIMKQDFEILKGRMVTTLILYHFIMLGVNMLRSLPLIGILVELWVSYSNDIPRIYGLASTLYWLGNGKSSPVISSLMHKDPYASPKIMAVSGTLFIPNPLCKLIAKLFPDRLLSIFGNSLTIVKRIQTNPLLDEAKGTGKPNHWVSIVDDLLQDLAFHDNKMLIKAPTASGKSTMLAAALTAKNRKCILLTPRRFLRDSYSNPWMQDVDVQIVKANVVFRNRPLSVMTYGHMNARISKGLLPEKDDILLFDEFHENDPEMGIAWFKTDFCQRLALSATPDSIYDRNLHVYKAEIQRPFVEPETHYLDLTGVHLAQEAIKMFGESLKYLYITPSLTKASKLTTSIGSMNREVTLLTSRSKIPSETGDHVATQVVDSGANIDVDVVVDEGLMVRNHKGRIVTTASDPLTHIQRKGRAGRKRKGYSVASKIAGKGAMTIPYPTWARICGDQSVQDFLFSCLSIWYEILPAETPSRIDPYMEWKFQIDKFYEASISFYWLLLCSRLTKEEIDLTYDSICLMGWTENYTGYRTILLSRLNTCQLKPLHEAKTILNKRPFLVKNLTNLKVEASGILVRDNSVNLLQGPM